MANSIKSFTRKTGGSNVQKVGLRKVKRTVAKKITTVKKIKPKQKVKVDPLNRIENGVNKNLWANQKIGNSWEKLEELLYARHNAYEKYKKDTNKNITFKEYARMQKAIH